MQAELNSTLMNLTIVDVPGEKANKYYFLNLFLNFRYDLFENQT